MGVDQMVEYLKMVKEDILLREEMGKLEIEPIKLDGSRNDENPFVPHSKRGLLKSRTQNRSCLCPNNKNINNGIYKKRSKILKEPMLHFLKTCTDHNSLSTQKWEQEASTSKPQNINIDSLNLCTLVKNCNQLKISSDSNEQIKKVNTKDKTKWWKNDVVCSRENRKHRHKEQAGSCSQQALNPQCDITIDELASYFETLVHIPKKMSSMAEMMYI